MPVSDAPPQYLIDRTVRVNVPSGSGSASGRSNDNSGGQIFTANVKSPAAEWLRPAVAEVEELTSLAPNWNGYGAKSVDAGSAVAAVQFLLRAAYPNISRPDIVPVSDGGVQVEWHRGGVDFEVCFSPEESLVYVDKADAEGDPQEFPIANALSIFSGVRQQLQEA